MSRPQSPRRRRAAAKEDAVDFDGDTQTYHIGDVTHYRDVAGKHDLQKPRIDRLSSVLRQNAPRGAQVAGPVHELSHSKFMVRCASEPLATSQYRVSVQKEFPEATLVTKADMDVWRIPFVVDYKARGLLCLNICIAVCLFVLLGICLQGILWLIQTRSITETLYKLVPRDDYPAFWSLMPSQT